MIFNRHVSVRSILLAGFAAGAMMTASAQAANVTDAASCSEAVQNSESAIVKAKVASDVLDKLVVMAEQASNACAAADFAKATTITNTIEQTLKEVAQN